MRESDVELTEEEELVVIGLVLCGIAVQACCDVCTIELGTKMTAWFYISFGFISAVGNVTMCMLEFYLEQESVKFVVYWLAWSVASLALGGVLLGAIYKHSIPLLRGWILGASLLEVAGAFCTICAFIQWLTRWDKQRRDCTAYHESIGLMWSLAFGVFNCPFLILFKVYLIVVVYSYYKRCSVLQKMQTLPHGPPRR